MLGEVYITSAIGLFIAAFGWSDKIFGFSRRIIQAELSFCERISMKYSNYQKLLKTLHTKYENPGEYTQDIIGLVKGTKLKSGSTEAFKKLKNNYLILGKWKPLNHKKKLFFGSLVLSFFILGTLLILIQNSFLVVLFSQLFILLLFILGYYLQKSLNQLENKFENNMNALFMHNRSN
jgi:hypothetical protein